MLERHPDWIVVGLDKLTYAGNLDNLSALGAPQQKQFVFVRGDINDRALLPRLFEQHQLEAVVNFAAESHVDRSIHDPQVFLQTNVLGTQSLVEACQHAWKKGEQWREGRRFLQVSTDEVYGSLGPSGSFREDSPLDPHSPYSASKAAADMVVKAYHDTFGLPALITRCSNNYGPYQFPEKLIPLMIRNALAHRELPVYGDGRQVRDWLHVADHCAALEAVLVRGRVGAVYNIGGNNERENIGIVRLLLDELRAATKDPGITDLLIKHITDRPGHDRRYAIDASRIRGELGWRPGISFEEGIRATVRWYLDHQAWTERVISGEYRKFYNLHYTSLGAKPDQG